MATNTNTAAAAAEKHTPGPWHVGQGNGEGSIFSDDGRMRLETGGTTLYPICEINHGWSKDEDDANARLIAAAPDLLEALTLALPYVEMAEHDEAYKRGEVAKMVRTMREAIAKAIGE